MLSYETFEVACLSVCLSVCVVMLLIGVCPSYKGRDWVSVELCDLAVPCNLPAVRRLDGTGCSNGDAAVLLL